MDEKIVVESKILFASPNCCIISLPYVQVDHDHMCVRARWVEYTNYWQCDSGNHKILHEFVFLFLTEITSAHRRGKIASMVGIEGGHSLGNSIAVLRMFYSLGARYLTLTHTCNTPW